MASLKTELLKRMSYESGWVHGGEIERWEIPHPNGGFYKPGTIGREMRHLSEEGNDGRIENKKNERGHVLYRYLPSKEEMFHWKITNNVRYRRHSK